MASPKQPGQYKLTQSQVVEIQRLLDLPVEQRPTWLALSLTYGVSPRTIGYIFAKARARDRSQK